MAHHKNDDDDDDDDDQPQPSDQVLLPLEESPSSPRPTKIWIRGVNIGGWLLAERFITPYLFALNTCHLAGELCWYPGQIGAPPQGTTATNICDPKRCHPVLPIPVTEGNADYHPRNPQSYMEYPIDEYTLAQTFRNHSILLQQQQQQSVKRGNNKTTSTNIHYNDEIARRYMERHWDTFVTRDDLVRLHDAGVTHLRVPLSFWIRGDIDSAAGEPWIAGGWPYFVRLCQWCREIGNLQVWADLHGAPGSENGFDNSGKYNKTGSTCEGWSTNATHVNRTLRILADLSQGIADDELQDVVTGFGVLNEPFLDCNESVLRNYYNAALITVRSILGPDTAVFVGDMFNAWKFNNGFWTDPVLHSNTYMDSHPYHVFFEKGRAMTPKQHIAYVCRHNYRDVVSCCQDDYLTDKMVPSRGISRIVGEWSGAFDVLPTAMAPYIMRTIAATGVAPMLNRTFSVERRAFLRNFCESQMVTYEAQESGMSSGWLFWNFKME
jgi:glucan 1,3-beta-glucosidase